MTNNNLEIKSPAEDDEISLLDILQGLCCTNTPEAGNLGP